MLLLNDGLCNILQTPSYMLSKTEHLQLEKNITSEGAMHQHDRCYPPSILPKGNPMPDDNITHYFVALHTKRVKLWLV